MDDPVDLDVEFFEQTERDLTAQTRKRRALLLVGFLVVCAGAVGAFALVAGGRLGDVLVKYDAKNRDESLAGVFAPVPAADFTTTVDSCGVGAGRVVEIDGTLSVRNVRAAGIYRVTVEFLPAVDGSALDEKLESADTTYITDTKPAEWSVQTQLLRKDDVQGDLGGVELTVTDCAVTGVERRLGDG